MTAGSFQLGLQHDPRQHDPGAWGASLLHNAELVVAVLDACGGTSITEVGALDGDLTRLLLRFSERAGGTVIAVEPAPHDELEALARDRRGLDLVRQTSLEALGQIPLTDVIILDGDHNYYTVSRELRLIAQRAADAGRQLPLVLLHDVCWPHGRRDDYYVPERIPVEHRQPIAAQAALFPGDPGTREGAVPYHHPASREGGPRNGVLTAAEDFAAAHAQLRLAVVPAFFGLGVLWDTTGPCSQALETLLRPWDRNPQLERLERNRVLHLANTQVQLNIVRRTQARLAEQERQLQCQRELLQRMLDSRAFAAAERFLRLRHREPAFSRDAIQRALDEP